MTSDQWLSVGRDLVMLTVAVLVFYWGRERKHASDSIVTQLEQRDRRLESLERRFDNASAHYSELAGRVQVVIGRLDTMPDELRLRFLPLDRAMDMLEESRRDRAALWDAIRDRGLDRRGDKR